MATLKDKAKARSKAKDDRMGPPPDLIAKAEVAKPTPNLNSGLPYDAPPPLPPAFLYLRMLATIPGLRKRVGGGV